MIIYYVYLFIFCSLVFTESKPKPIDFEKGLDIKSMLPNQMLFNSSKKPLSEHEIDMIREKALNFNPEPISDSDIIIFKTTLGTFEARFFSDKAPNHCLNFKKLANSGFYDQTTFHRVIPDFMIQGGDILSRDTDSRNDGLGGPGWTIDAEFNDIKHVKGILSMARGRDINSAGSQFFICVSAAPHLDGKYTAFGEILNSDNSRINAILDHIANAATESKYALDMSVSSVPEDEDLSNWVLLKNPRNGQTIYSKVPNGQKKDLYKREMMSKLRNNNPIVPIVIKEVRVINRESK
jgi:cyclophilin family peptidyl-prolyl cis-trans isomerase